MPQLDHVGDSMRACLLIVVSVVIAFCLGRFVLFDADQKGAQNYSEIRSKSLDLGRIGSSRESFLLEDHLRELEGFSADQLKSAVRAINLRGASQEGDLLLLRRMFQNLSKKDPYEALQLLALVDHGIRWQVVSSIFSGWSQVDFAAADKYLRDPSSNVMLHDSRFAEHMLKGIAQTAASLPLEKAQQWLGSLKALDPKGVAMKKAVSQLMLSDPQMAAELLSNPDGSSNTDAWAMLAKYWGSVAPDEALVWAESLDIEDREVVIGAMVHGWMNQDLSAAVQYVERNPSEHVITAASEAWSERDPKAASLWAFEKGSGRGFQLALLKWTAINPEEASGYLVNLEDGPVKDRGIQSMAQTIIDSDPQSALTWVMAVSEPEHRYGLLKSSLRTWYKKEGREMVTAWALSVGGFSEQESEFLRAEFGMDLSH